MSIQPLPSGVPRACTAILPALVAVAALAAAGASAAEAADFAPSDTYCQVAAYRSAGGEAAVMTKRDKGWRYLFVDGRYGFTNQSNPMAFCSAGGLEVKRPNGTIETWAKVPLRYTQTRFQSDGSTLSGVLIEPQAAAGAKPPLVVFVHGSGDGGWIDGNYSEPYHFAAAGIAAFVYDKRGTGLSAGVYNQNFRALAGDVAAAAAEARRLAGGRYGRVGLYGLSQGGWVAPLAAKASGADFLVIGYGGIFTPLEEDATQVFLELREKGYDDEVIAKAREVTDATGAVMASHFERGFDRLAAVKSKYGAEPWFKQIKGEFTGDLLTASETELRANGRAEHDNLELEWDYDSMPVLRGLSTPILWVNGLEDREAPIELTLSRLATLQREGKPITVANFPDTDHGIFEFTQAEDGTRTYTRVADGYYRLLTDWITGRSSPPYGKAKIEPPPR